MQTHHNGLLTKSEIITALDLTPGRFVSMGLKPAGLRGSEPVYDLNKAMRAAMIGEVIAPTGSLKGLFNRIGRIVAAR